MNRRNFLAKLGLGTVAAATVPIQLQWKSEPSPVTGFSTVVTRKVNVPRCGSCKEPLILKGAGANIYISCTNEKCHAFYDDETIERMCKGPLGVSEDWVDEDA
jgi:hypothetical protein